MAKRLNTAFEPTKAKTDTGRSGSRPKPPKAVSRSDSLEALRPVSDHKRSKQRLTDKTVAFARTSQQPSAQRSAQPSKKQLRRPSPVPTRTSVGR